MTHAFLGDEHDEIAAQVLHDVPERVPSRAHLEICRQRDSAVTSVLIVDTDREALGGWARLNLAPVPGKVLALEVESRKRPEGL